LTESVDFAQADEEAQTIVFSANIAKIQLAQKLLISKTYKK
jgi:hypothetical protein